MTVSSYIQTFYGNKIDFYNVTKDDIDIRDIAHALCYTPRFSGHTSRFYSVAAHSMAVAGLVPAEFKLVALLHDATEAYLTDMPSPFKALLPDYQALENRVWRAIADKFALPYELPECVKIADKMCLMKEADELKPNRDPFSDDLENYMRAPYLVNLSTSHTRATTSFLTTFYYYYGGAD